LVERGIQLEKHHSPFAFGWFVRPHAAGFVFANPVPISFASLALLAHQQSFFGVQENRSF
jgi:hypothetical protein